MEAQDSEKRSNYDGTKDEGEHTWILVFVVTKHLLATSLIVWDNGYKSRKTLHRLWSTVNGLDEINASLLRMSQFGQSLKLCSRNIRGRSKIGKLVGMSPQRRTNRILVISN